MPAALQGGPPTQKGSGSMLCTFMAIGSKRDMGIMLLGKGSVTIWPLGAMCGVVGSYMVLAIIGRPRGSVARVLLPAALIAAPKSPLRYACVGTENVPGK